MEPLPLLNFKRHTSTCVNFWILFKTYCKIRKLTTHRRFFKQKKWNAQFPPVKCWQVVRLSGEKHSDKMEEAKRWGELIIFRYITESTIDITPRIIYYTYITHFI